MQVGTAMTRELDVIREELRCFICRETLRDPHCLGCNHNYCKLCIDVQLRKAVSQCPKCKIPMCPSDVHRNQFLDGLLQEWRLVEASLASAPSPSPPVDITKHTPAVLVSPAVKRKLPLDFASPPPHTSIVATQHATDPESMASLMNTPQLESYRARLQRHAADLDESCTLNTNTTSPNDMSCSRTRTPSPATDPTNGSNEPTVPHAPPPLAVASAPHPPESHSTSSQETAMSIKTPSPILLVPQSPPRSRAAAVSFHALPTSRLPAVVSATQDDPIDDDDDDECVAETEFQGGHDSVLLGDESQLLDACPLTPTQHASELTIDDQSMAPFENPHHSVPDVNSPSFRIVDATPATSFTKDDGESAQPTKGVCIVATNVTKAHRRLLLDCVRGLGGRFSLHFHRPQHSNGSRHTDCTTHVVTSADAAMRCPRTQSILLGMAHGCWIVSIHWVVASWKARRWVDEAPFEVAGDTSAMQATAVPRRCRQMHSTHIFRGMRVMPLHSPIEQSDAMEAVVVACGGVWRSYQDGERVEGDVIGVVSKTLSVAACHELVDKHAAYRRDMPVVRVAWVIDSISHMECRPFAAYSVASWEG